MEGEREKERKRKRKVEQNTEKRKTGYSSLRQPCEDSAIFRPVSQIRFSQLYGQDNKWPGFTRPESVRPTYEIGDKDFCFLADKHTKK